MTYHDTEDGSVPACVEQVIEAIRRFGFISNTTETVGKVTIDFFTETEGSLNMLQRARGGEFGSSVVIDTTNCEVTFGTIRFGSLGLSDDADRFIAESEWKKAVEETDPPGDVNVRLRHGTGDILHVDTDKRIPAKQYAQWLPRVVRKAEMKKDDIAEFAEEIGDDLGTGQDYRTRYDPDR